MKNDITRIHRTPLTPSRAVPYRGLTPLGRAIQKHAGRKTLSFLMKVALLIKPYNAK